MASVMEPALQRELRQRDNESKGYAAELIGYAEIVAAE
jgi:hypothetical protein